MKEYTGDYAQKITFPLSGIGTGGISITGLGELVDWEPDGRANKDTRNEYTHFAVKAERDGSVLGARVLHGDRTTDLSGTSLAAHHHSWGFGHGLNRTTLGGISHFRDVTFTGEFPFARLSYHDDAIPAKISLCAFNPFIPQNEDESSLPAAFFLWEITNTSDKPTDFSLAFSVGNPFRIRDGGFSAFEKSGTLSSITLKSRNYAPEDLSYGELTVATDCPEVSYQEYWYRSSWFDDLTTFWREFSAPGKLHNRHYDDGDPHGQGDIGDMSTLCAHLSLAPGETGHIRFVLSWYYPHFVKYWDGNKPHWNHEYVRRFSSSADVRDHCFAQFDPLFEASDRFRRALAEMTLPDAAKEAACDNLCVLKSAVCLRLENGEFWGFEGTNGHGGSCEGTCDHVWNYQYALAFLFPRLARQILEIDYAHNMKSSGEMLFRTMLPLGSADPEKRGGRGCADGQFGNVLRAYREWKLSGDDEWLKTWWDSIERSLSYAWNPENRDLWDPKKTGALWGRQHHTLDVELFGPTAWLTGFYLAALKAGAEMADALGKHETANEYRTIFARGQKFLETELFNGKHYVQKIDLSDRSVLTPFEKYDPSVASFYWNEETQEIKYQLGEGCEIDQGLAQWHAYLIGLGDIFDPEHGKTAARTLYETNFRSMRDVFNPCRIFAVNDESGLLICNWAPDAYKPKIPIPYTEECMTGYEYAAAGLMIRYGLVEEGLRVIEAIRDRYDGKKRDPFSEIECGADYARSMASFAFPALFSGYSFDMTKGEIGFAPIGNGLHRTFWSMDGAWGTAEIGENGVTLSVLWGSIALSALRIPFASRIGAVSADGNPVSFTVSDDRVRFSEKTAIRNTLTLKCSF